MQKVLVFGYGPMLNQDSARKILKDVDDVDEKYELILINDKFIDLSGELVMENVDKAIEDCDIAVAVGVNIDDADSAMDLMEDFYMNGNAALCYIMKYTSDVDKLVATTSLYTMEV